MTMTDKQHALTFNFLIGKQITHVRYMSNKESNDFGFYKRPLIIYFDDDSILIPQSDDEGNDGGAMFYQNKEKEETIYVL
tara:strand:+ start:2639 stop:2878 length:240 start_codon:yes stop_codon:yes gene_type:complete